MTRAASNKKSPAENVGGNIGCGAQLWQMFGRSVEFIRAHISGNGNGGCGNGGTA